MLMICFDCLKSEAYLIDYMYCNMCMFNIVYRLFTITCLFYYNLYIRYKVDFEMSLIVNIICFRNPFEQRRIYSLCERIAQIRAGTAHPL